MPQQLKRSLSLWQISLYGIGSILGAGIYVLLGEVSKVSGYDTPSAFLLAGLIVSFSAYSYGQLCQLLPYSAGEAVYIQHAFNRERLSQIVGFAIVFAGIVSSATLVNGFIGYFGIFATVPPVPTTFIIVIMIGLIAAWGVNQSAWVAAVTTVVEIFGLVLVIYVTKDNWGNADLSLFTPSLSTITQTSVVSGAFLAFYAFIGFEDMVNMAEEVKNPKRNMPISIGIALIFTMALYLIIAMAALISVPLDELSNSQQPLALIISQNSQIPIEVMGAISLIAILNGAMIQVIMAARVIYGMANKHLFFAAFAQVHPKTQTPLIATIAVAGLVLFFALALPLAALAQLTSGFILFVFCAVNLALLKLRLQEASKTFIQLTLPLIGAISCAAFILFKLNP